MPLSSNTYGKSRVRLVKVTRGAHTTGFVEWTVHILFKGAFDQAYTAGDNSLVLPTDTMKNTVYSLARDSSATCPEEFAIELAQFFLEHNAETSQVQIEILQKPWKHLIVNGAPDPACFRLAGNELQTAHVTAQRTGMHVLSGLRDLSIMKTAHSSFSGFKRDRLTTLKEADDRLLGTALRAEWGFPETHAHYENIRLAVRETLLATFATHHSLSVQHTLYAMGEAVLAAIPEVAHIKLSMPNLHCLLVDLRAFGQDNPNRIFVPIDEPHGYIEAELRR